MPYDDFPCPTSHPDAVAAIATLLGLSPAPVAACGVLELGCGSGGNLIPMAAALPGSRFVGVDLSEVQIAAGRAAAAALGLTNLTLHVADIARLPPLGPFDYVIAHGVFSWVPRDVQEALLAAAQACLSAQGVAYVSFAALPGAYARMALRDLLRWQARGEAAPLQRVARAREAAAFLATHATHSARGAPLGAVLRRLAGEVAGMSDAYLLHDHLAEVYAPSTLVDFVARAEAHGLQYLADAQFHSMFPSVEPEAIQAFLGGAQPVEAEQLQDYVDSRGFRAALLCRAEAQVDRGLDWRRLRSLHLTTQAQPRGEEDGHWMFRTPLGERFGTPSERVAEALTQLAEAHPRPVAFAALAGGDEALLGPDLLAAFGCDQVGVGASSRDIETDPSGLATAFAPARAQAARGSPWVTNLWHRVVALSPLQRALLGRLDGQTTRAALLAALPGLGPDGLEVQLSFFAEHALLVRAPSGTARP